MRSGKGFPREEVSLCLRLEHQKQLVHDFFNSYNHTALLKPNACVLNIYLAADTSKYLGMCMYRIDLKQKKAVV